MKRTQRKKTAYERVLQYEADKLNSTFVSVLERIIRKMDTISRLRKKEENCRKATYGSIPLEACWSCKNGYTIEKTDRHIICDFLNADSYNKKRLQFQQERIEDNLNVALDVLSSSRLATEQRQGESAVEAGPPRVNIDSIKRLLTSIVKENDRGGIKRKRRSVHFEEEEDEIAENGRKRRRRSSSSSSDDYNVLQNTTTVMRLERIDEGGDVDDSIKKKLEMLEKEFRLTAKYITFMSKVYSDN